MKQNVIFLLLYLSIVGIQQVANAQTFPSLDKSPMDMSYYPNDFAHDRKFAPEKVGDKAYIRLTYSRPAKKNRVVFGDLIAYNKVWRVGANEAPEIKFYQKVTILGKKLKAGVYSMYILPTENEWTIIFNSDLDTWGAYSYNEAKDVLRVKVAPKTATEAIEYLSIQFVEGANKEALLQLGWDKTMVELPIVVE